MLSHSSTLSPASSRQSSRSSQKSDRLVELLKSLYQADHQIKLLHLHAEADTLLQQLQTLKQQRQDSTPSDHN